MANIAKEVDRMLLEDEAGTTEEGKGGRWVNTHSLAPELRVNAEIPNP
jgi:hypothetical protein